MLSKADCKVLLRMCKEFVRLNHYLNTYKISQPAISNFVNRNDRDEFISQDNLNKLCNEIYGSCKLYCDIYEQLDIK